MTAYIGCFGLLGIAGFILFLFLRRRKTDNEMTEFYKENSLYTSENCPPNVRESLGAASDNLYCCQSHLMTAAGERVEFCWWEWYLKSTTMVGGAPTASFTHYLAVSFAPNSVSDEFVRKALQSADKSGDDLAQKAKDFFVNNTDTPYRVETLADGSLIICWRTVTKRRDIYDAKIAWLKNNVVPSAASAPFEMIDEALPDESKTVVPEAVETNSSQTSGTVFYRHDNYAALRYSLSSVWTNLDLEMHRFSSKFDKEGYDEYESDANFNDRSCPNDAIFTLTGKTTAGEAQRLFEEFFGGHAYILRDGIAVEKGKTLADCNQP